MGKKWDYDVPSVELWQEVLRVLKPGGHALIACGTRTQHRMVCNIEDAGFEIRDVISWVYGSGFPKSLNVGKMIDQMQGNERKVIGNDRSGAKRNYMRDDYKGGIYDLTRGTSPYEGWGTALKPAVEFFTLVRKPISEKNIAENVLKWGTGGINIDGCRVVAEFAVQVSRFHKSATQFGGQYSHTFSILNWLRSSPASTTHPRSPPPPKRRCPLAPTNGAP